MTIWPPIKNESYVTFFVFKRSGHGGRDHIRIRAHIFGPAQHLDRLKPVGVVVFIQPDGRPDQRAHNRLGGVGILFDKAFGHAEHFFRIVLPDFIVGDDRHADAHGDRLLVPRLAHAVPVDGACLQCCRHLGRRRHRQERLRVDLAGCVVRAVKTGVNTTRCQPITQFVVVGGHREHHAHVERFATRGKIVNDRLERLGTDRMLWQAVGPAWDMRAHHVPHFVGNRDAVAVQVHGKGRDDVGLCAIADGRGDGLTGQHVRAFEGAVNDAVQQHFPVCLCLQRDKQTFIQKIALFIGHSQRGHVGQLDKAKCQFVNFQRLGPAGRAQRGCYRKRQEEFLHESVLV